MRASAQRIAELSGEEAIASLGLDRGPAWVTAAARAAFVAASQPLGRALARFDEGVAEHGIAEAARDTLRGLGAEVAAFGHAPPAGPLLIVANHPGAYDALALMAAAGRRDLAILAADRAFLRAMPEVARHLVHLPEGKAGRAAGLLRAVRHLRGGGALLQFAAGTIEPDPAFTDGTTELLGDWGAGTGALVRAASRVRAEIWLGLASGVHSARAKRLWVTRLAEARGITMLAPLLQMGVPGFRDVSIRVAFTQVRDAEALARDGGDAHIARRLRAHALDALRSSRPSR